MKGASSAANQRSEPVRLQHFHGSPKDPECAVKRKQPQ